MIKLIKKLIKSVGSSVVGAGVLVVVRSVIKCNTQSSVGIIGRVLVDIGSLAIAGFVARKVQTEFKEQVDLQFVEIEKIEMNQ